MSVSFFKHKKALIDAYKDVLDDGSDTDWALFTYEGKDNELKVDGTGEDGLEELESEFNSSKIMYAFIRVKDPKTSLHKFIFLHWQGEGAPANRKGACASHVRDVERFFKGAHITINARNEDDVTPEQIMEQVERASASTYSFDKQHGGEYDEPAKPVGSVYKKTNAAQDIDSLKKQGSHYDAPIGPVGTTYKPTNAAADISASRKLSVNYDEPAGPVGSSYKRTNAAQDIESVKNSGGGYNAPSEPVGSVYKRTNAAGDISSMRKQSGNYDDETGPVGSVYRKTNAAAEIGSSQNDSYWLRQHREEEERKKEDERKKAEEKRRYAEEVKAREKESAERRRQWEMAREHEITEKVRATRLADDRAENLRQEKARYEAEQREFEAASQRGRKRSESTEKAVAAAQLVQQRGENPRAMWQQRIAETNKPAPAPDRNQLRNRVGSIENYRPPIEEDDSQNYDDVYHEPTYTQEPQPSYGQTQPTYNEPQPAEPYHEPQPTCDDVASAYDEPQPAEPYHEPQVYEDTSYPPQNPPESQPAPTYEDAQPIYDDAQQIYDDASPGYAQQQENYAPVEDTGCRARAIYDYQAADETEISFDPDDIITNISMIDEGWWQGTTPNGMYGLFPANYVELLE